MRRILWIAAAAALALPPSLFAQRTTGSLTGVVKDTTGAALPGVTVGVTGPNIVGTQTSVTNESGIYRVANLPPGDYGVVVTRDLEQGEWFDPSVLERLLPAATPVTIVGTDKATLDLKLR